MCIFGCFLPSVGVFKLNVLKYNFRNTITMSNSLDPDQFRRFDCPDLGPNYLQRLLVDDTGSIEATTYINVNIHCITNVKTHFEVM